MHVTTGDHNLVRFLTIILWFYNRPSPENISGEAIDLSKYIKNVVIQGSRRTLRVPSQSSAGNVAWIAAGVSACIIADLTADVSASVAIGLAAGFVVVFKA